MCLIMMSIVCFNDFDCFKMGLIGVTLVLIGFIMVLIGSIINGFDFLF